MNRLSKPGFLWCLAFALVILLSGEAGAQPAKPRVLCGIFPAFLIAREILPESDFSLEILLPDNIGCAHHYTLTPGDMTTIGAVDVYVSVGNALEGFLARILQEFPHLRVIDCSARVRLPPEIGTPEGNAHFFSCLYGLEEMGRQLAAAMIDLYPAKKQVLEERLAAFLAAIAGKRRALQELGISGKKIPVAIIHNSLEFALREVGFEIAEEIDSDGDHNTTLSPRELLAKIAAFQEKGIRAIFYDTFSPPPVAQTLSQEAKIPLIRWYSLSLRDPDIPVEKVITSCFDANLDMLKKLFTDDQN